MMQPHAMFWIPILKRKIFIKNFLITEVNKICDSSFPFKISLIVNF